MENYKLNWEFEVIMVSFYKKNLTYSRVSLTYNNHKYAEDCRVYWFDMAYRLPFAKIRILKRINRDISKQEGKE